jgi:hypothetical protein
MVTMVFKCVLGVFFKCFISIFQVFQLVSDVCCNRCIWMFHPPEPARHPYERGMGGGGYVRRGWEQGHRRVVTQGVAGTQFCFDSILHEGGAARASNWEPPPDTGLGPDVQALGLPQIQVHMLMIKNVEDTYTTRERSFGAAR